MSASDRENSIPCGAAISSCARQFPILAALILAVALGCLTSASAGQKEKPQKGNKGDSLETGLSIPVPDTQAVDLVVSQMLGAWQVGDVEMLHKSYADDVMVVSAAFEPPLQGWQNYAKAYQAQLGRSRGVLDRSNSYIKVDGTQAWVTYQWQYSGQVDGVPIKALGHTTLILQKRSGTWLIVLNHTSGLPGAAQPAPQPTAASDALSKTIH